MPEFYNELTCALKDVGRTDMLSQMADLSIARYTYDEDVQAIYIYVDGVRELNEVERNIVGVRHKECIDLSGLSGMVVLDIDNFDRVIGIEVLNRPEVYEMLK